MAPMTSANPKGTYHRENPPASKTAKAAKSALSFLREKSGFHMPTEYKLAESTPRTIAVEKKRTGNIAPPIGLSFGTVGTMLTMGPKRKRSPKTRPSPKSAQTMGSRIKRFSNCLQINARPIFDINVKRRWCRTKNEC